MLLPSVTDQLRIFQLLPLWWILPRARYHGLLANRAMLNCRVG